MEKTKTLNNLLSVKSQAGSFLRERVRLLIEYILIAITISLLSLAFSMLNRMEDLQSQLVDSQEQVRALTSLAVSSASYNMRSVILYIACCQ